MADAYDRACRQGLSFIYSVSPQRLFRAQAAAWYERKYLRPQRDLRAWLLLCARWGATLGPRGVRIVLP